MSKIYINILVPASGTSIEIKVSSKIKIGKLVEMIKEYLKNNETTGFEPNDSTSLCDAKKGIVYSNNARLMDLDICDGHEMLLM
ncbi:MAG: hypothetical protein IJA27_09180 [Lachnospiraceae bacterium]|nr:hypothetical protein [Lachnospiraceae bacterium]